MIQGPTHICQCPCDCINKATITVLYANKKDNLLYEDNICALCEQLHYELDNPRK